MFFKLPKKNNHSCPTYFTILSSKTRFKKLRIIHVIYDHFNKAILCTILGDKNIYELSKLCTRFWLAEETISFKDFNSTA